MPLRMEAVIPLPVGDLLQHPANYFDLAHKRLRFTPRGPAYLIETRHSSGLWHTGTPQARQYSWKISPQFSFPFAGKLREHLYVNLNGNITFEAPETTTYPERDSWPDGSMRWLASSLDSRSVAGHRLMIAPLWGFNSSAATRVSVHSARREFIVTWDALRYHSTNEAYQPLGRSVFQVRLTPDGVIEFRYGDVAEKDGVVGVFDGKIVSNAASINDTGSGLRVSLPKIEGNGTYRAMVASDNELHIIQFDGNSASDRCFLIAASGSASPNDCAGQGHAGIADDRVFFYLPKIVLKDPATVRWKAGVVGSAEETGPLRGFTIATARLDLSLRESRSSGNTYEVFHYPFVSKSRMTAFKEIYRRSEPADDLAIVVTDFRIDDIHNHGASNRSGDDPRLSAKELFGSERLQSAAGPIYLGPRFAETIRDNDGEFKNYAFAIGWMAHELTHQWTARLKWKPENPDALLDPSCYCHWSPMLATPVLAPVWQLFSDKPYPQESVMGGMTIVKLPDGKMEGRVAPWGAATGLSPLDLYSMGMLGTDEVPDTTLIVNNNDVRVTIADIVAANGPQVKNAQRDFTFGLYLLHEDGREPYPEKLRQARGIEAMLVKYFAVASGGRMRITLR